MSDTKCVNAYMNLSIHPSGAIRPCCLTDKYLTTNEGHTRLNEASIKDFWFSNSRKDFADQLEKGMRIPECITCWKEEDAGKESKRIRDNKKYQERELDLSFKSLPIVLDLSMGNLCNIKCRICAPTHSTPWLQEEAELQSPNDVKGFMKQDKFRIGTESFHKDNKFVWEDIKELLEYAEHFDFAGGEPFYIESHWKILKYCVDNGYSHNQVVHYNTNGTIFPDKQINILNKFKVIDIQVSSDGVGPKFEYLRHGANWDKSEEVIDNFLKEKEKNETEWLVGACLSLSAFNAFDFFETYEHYAAKGLRMYINTVHDHRGVRILPWEIKSQLIEKISQTKSKHDPMDWKKQKDMICALLKNSKNSFCNIAWTNWCKEIKMRDKFRNESFEKTFPEYFYMLKDYFNV